MSQREELVRERAYAIWLAEGQPSGCEQEHWERAVREVDGGTADKAPARRKSAAKPANDVAAAKIADTKPAATKQPAKAKKASAPAAATKAKAAKRG